MIFAKKIMNFIRELHFPVTLPTGIEVMNPFHDALTLELCHQFYKKYYTDNTQRWMIIGINPGRFGAGITGIPFTDPIRLQNNCGIANSWPKKQELSSVFIYELIHSLSGPEAFYEKFYITATSPLGFIKDNKNLNYYDERLLKESIKEFVVDCLSRQLDFGIHRHAAFCLGDGKNCSYLSRLNKEMNFFDTIMPLPHPRYIMQYRLKQKEEYIQFYINQFKLFCY